MRKSLLITGALGHIGSKLIHSIRSGEFEHIRLVDNLSSQRYCSLFDLPKGVNWEFIEDDITSDSFAKRLEGIDAVVHLAAITDAAQSFSRQEEIESINYFGTKRIAEICTQSNIRLFFPSTTSVYGKQIGLVDETCSGTELKPQSPYADYKLKCENMLIEKSEADGLKVFIGRLGTIFGASIGMRFHTAVNKFCWQSVNRQPLSVWRTALDQERPYLGVNDAVRAIKLVIEEDLFDNRIYNVLTTNSTVRKIIDLIKNDVRNVEIELVDIEIMNQLSYRVSGARFATKGFRPSDELQIGIRDTIKLLAELNLDVRSAR